MSPKGQPQVKARKRMDYARAAVRMGLNQKCMESNEIIWNVIYSRQRTGIVLVLCLPSLSHVPASGSEKDHGVRVVAA